MGLFSGKTPTRTPGISGGMNPQGNLPSMPTEQGWGAKDWLGYGLMGIGDAFTNANGGNGQSLPLALQGVQRAKEAQMEAQAKLQDRTADRNEWDRRELFKAAHEVPTPQQPLELERLMAGAGIDPKSEQGISMFGQAAANKANPPEYRQGPDGKFYRVEIAPGRRPIGSEVADPDVASSQAGMPSPEEIERVRQSFQLTFPGPKGQSLFADWQNRNFGGR